MDCPAPVSSTAEENQNPWGSNFVIQRPQQIQYSKKKGDRRSPLRQWPAVSLSGDNPSHTKAERYFSYFHSCVSFYQVFSIPARADHWEATNYPDLTDFAERTGLKMVGIIHTHPDFGPQPSSVDLHQLHDLQRENSSAVSIIISPSQNIDRTYSLTAFGMDRLSKCHSTKEFHRHNEPRDLYQAASNVVWYSGVTVLEDQR